MNNSQRSQVNQIFHGSRHLNPQDRRSWIKKIRDRLWGYDFFVSYHWESGGRYGVNLAQRLTEAKFDVFLDRAEYAMGDDWKRVGEEALANTQRLVLIATRPAVTTSDPVEREVSIFSKRKRQIIPIVFDDDFSDLDWQNSSVLSRIEESKLRINETAENLENGPSKEIIQQLVKTHGIMRRRILRRWLIVIVVALISLAGLFAERQREIAVEQKKIAEERYAQSEARYLWSRLVFTSDELSADEVDALWQLSVAEKPIKDEFLEQLFRTKSLGQRFSKKYTEISRAIFVFDTSYRQETIKVLNELTQKSETQIPFNLYDIYLRLALGVEVSIQDLSRVIKKTTGKDQLEKLKIVLPRVVATMPAMQAVWEVERLLKALNEDGYAHYDQYELMFNVLIAVAAKVPNVLAVEASEILVGALRDSGTGGGWRNHEKLENVLSVVTPKVPETQAVQVIEVLLKEIKENYNPYVISELVRGFAPIATIVPESQAVQMVELLLAETIENIDFSRYQRDGEILSNTMGEILSAVAAKVPEGRAVYMVESLLEAMTGVAIDKQLNVLGEGLSAVAAKIPEEHAVNVTQTLLAAINGTTADARLTELGKGLEAVVSRVLEVQVVPITKMLLAAIDEVTTDYQLIALGEGLNAISPRIPGALVLQTAEALVEVVQADAFRIYDPYSNILSNVAVNVPKAQSVHMVEVLLTFLNMSPEEIYSFSYRFGECLQAVAVNVPETKAVSLVETFLETIKEEPRESKNGVLDKGLQAVSSKIPESQATMIVNTYLKAIKDMEWRKVYRLKDGLSAVSAKVPETKAVFLTEVFLEVIKDTIDSHHLAVIGTGFQAVVNKVPNNQAVSVSEKILRALKDTSDGPQLEALGEGLSVLVKNNPEMQVVHITETLLNVIKVTTADSKISALGNVLKKVSINVSEGQAVNVAERYLQTIKETTKDVQRKELTKGLSAIVTNIPETHVVSFAQILINTKTEIEESDPGLSESLKEGLFAILAKADTQAASLSELLIVTVEQTDNYEALELLEGLPSVVANVQETHAMIVFDRLLRGLKRDFDEDTAAFIGVVFRESLFVVAEKIQGDEHDINFVFDVLKIPSLPKGLEHVFLATLHEKLVDDDGKTDIWTLAGLAKEKYPSLDLSGVSSFTPEEYRQ